MNTYLTVTANTSSVDAIRCAYNTLLSFENIYDSYLKENIHTAYANLAYDLIYKGKPFKKKMDIACLITISAITDNLCTMEITVNTAGIVGLGETIVGKTHEFAAEYLKRFSEALEASNV